MSESNKVVGPELPPHLRSSQPPKDESDSPDHSPVRPSSSEKKIKAPSIGPTLPPHLRHLEASQDSDDDSSDSDQMVGPSPNLQGGEYDMRQEFAEREKRAKEAQSAAPERDSWMTQLPTDRTGVKIGMGARTFSKRDATEPTLDAGWTETPGQEKKQADEKLAENDQLVRAQRKRDAEIDRELDRYNAEKRSKPLIDLHRTEHEDKKKSKKKEKKKDKKKDKKEKKSKKKSKKQKSDEKNTNNERKPFNWEEDMRVSMVDTTRAKGMLDKTVLQSRFATGKTQKYL